MGNPAIIKVLQEAIRRSQQAAAAGKKVGEELRKTQG